MCILELLVPEEILIKYLLQNQFWINQENNIYMKMDQITKLGKMSLLGPHLLEIINQFMIEIDIDNWLVHNL